MAWIEQTKKASRKSGGPQYYLQDLSDTTRDLLVQRGRCPIRLWTPYGVRDSGLTAVSREVGRVGHDRVQSGRAAPSVADQIAHWYCLNRRDIERIEFADSFDRDAFVIRPTHSKFFGRRTRKVLYPDSHPLTVVANHRAPLIVQQLRRGGGLDRRWREWVQAQLREIVADHEKGEPNVDERDLLRASGALERLGIKIGMYRSRGIDCPDARFELCGYPPYPCQVEIEERSSGFLAPQHRAHRRERVVVLCMSHDAPQVLQAYVDVIELRELLGAVA
jgi:hypothetical protein